MNTGGTGNSRVVEIDPQRLDRWIDGFTQRHGTPVRSDGPDPAAALLILSAPDGAEAQILAWSAAVVDLPERLGLILVRRGGYALGLASGAQLTDHYCGTRYVQSRTAAGGWSQQRFARRRGNQADALISRVAQQATERLLSNNRPLADALVVGGDKTLVRQVLDDRHLAPLSDLPAREFYDLPDPRFTVLQETLRRGRATRIRITEA